MAHNWEKNEIHTEQNQTFHTSLKQNRNDTSSLLQFLKREVERFLNFVVNEMGTKQGM